MSGNLNIIESQTDANFSVISRSLNSLLYEELLCNENNHFECISLDLWQVLKIILNIKVNGNAESGERLLKDDRLCRLCSPSCFQVTYAMYNERGSDFADFLGVLKNGIWLFGTSSWLFGLSDRSIASFADGHLSAIELMQLFTASFFFIGWLFLKPTSLKLLPWSSNN